MITTDIPLTYFKSSSSFFLDTHHDSELISTEYSCTGAKVLMEDWSQVDISEHSLVSIDDMFDHTDVDCVNDDQVQMYQPRLPILPSDDLMTQCHRGYHRHKRRRHSSNIEAQNACPKPDISFNVKKEPKISNLTTDSHKYCTDPLSSLQAALERSRESLEELQKYEFYVLGLPKCHARTVSKSRKSRIQLISSMEPTSSSPSKKRRTKK